MSTHESLLTYRDRFPILGRSTYLINNSLGAVPAATRQNLTRFVDEWEARGVRAWGDGWWVLQEEVGDLIAGILGVPAGTVSMHQNIAVALEMILSCFRFDGHGRDKIVYSALNFPSDQYIYEARARLGARLECVPGASDGLVTDVQRLVDAIDDSTRLVAIDHVMFRSSAIVDIAPIVAKARKVGAFVVLDTFHSVGIVPLALHDLGVHAAVGGALKWLCGGPGNCFLYVHPDEIARLEPTFTGWAAHKDPFAFAQGQDYRDDGGRFFTGTPNVPALYAGKAGIELVAEIGLPAIRERSQHLTGRLVEEAQRAGLELRSPLAATARGGHVSLDVPDGYAVCQALSAREIVVDFRPDAGLRVAPHFYNTEDEVVTAVRAIREILDAGEHRPFLKVERAPG